MNNEPVNTTPQVTVLTAIYNAEKYLRTCLDSLVAQTLSDVQFICIDDCSTDHSADIVREYANRDNRFLLIRTQQNSGQAVARNEGLKHATGQFITMLDSDDWLAPDALRLAVESIMKTPQADCAIFRLMLYQEDMGKTSDYTTKPIPQVMSGAEAFRLSLDWSLHGLYLIQAEIHKKYPFDTSARLYSDDNTTRMHYLHSRQVVRCEGQYFYRKHAASMTSAFSIQRFDYMDANLSMKQQLETEAEKNADIDSSKWQEYITFYENHRWLNLIDCYWYYFHYKQQFSPAERVQIEQRFADMLTTIDKKRIAPRHKYKFGYYPFRSFKVFSLVENLYFSIRKILFNNRIPR